MPLDQLTYEPDDEILSTLIRADGLLDGPEKWGQHNGYTNDNTLCVYGAVGVAAGIRPAYLHQSPRSQTCTIGAWLCDFAVESQFIVHGGEGHYDLAAYNDLPTTTYVDIKALFARAIQKRRAELRERVA